MIDVSETISIRSPNSITVLVYKSDNAPTWVTKVIVEAICVETDKPETFSKIFESDVKPSRQELADLVVEMLAHEVAEQLGLGPHQSGV